MANIVCGPLHHMTIYKNTYVVLRTFYGVLAIMAYIVNYNVNEYSILCTLCGVYFIMYTILRKIDDSSYISYIV